MPEELVAIKVASGNWGGARIEDVKAVADSVVHSFRESLIDSTSIRIRLEPTATANDNPIALSQLNANGDFVVHVNVKGNFWGQLGYQFAHEFCHVLADPSTWVQDRFAWVEEVFCEVASLFALRQMALNWATDSPYRNWRDYADSLGQYASDRMATLKPQLSGSEELSAWLTSHYSDLEANPYLREENMVIAVFLLPLIESNPMAWRVIRRIHSFARLQDWNVCDFMNAWNNACLSEVDKAFLHEAESAFGCGKNTG